jgi:hypothetical protein
MGDGAARRSAGRVSATDPGAMRKATTAWKNETARYRVGREHPSWPAGSAYPAEMIERSGCVRGARKVDGVLGLRDKLGHDLSSRLA